MEPHWRPSGLPYTGDPERVALHATLKASPYMRPKRVALQRRSPRADRLPGHHALLQLAVADDERAFHEHVAKPLRVLRRVLERRLVDHASRIEDDDVGVGAGAQPAFLPHR